MTFSSYRSDKPSTRPIKPVDSSTVIMVRDQEEDQFQLFLGRRHRETSFMGGAYVFPGGRLDPSDCSSAIVPFLKTDFIPTVQQKLGETKLDEARIRGLLVCALRELFEEAGVLLAYTESGELLKTKKEESATSFEFYRRLLFQEKISLLELAKKEKIVYALDQLIPFTHWITPEMGNSKRFNTRFFLSEMPAEQHAYHDGTELTESFWITPNHVLELQKAGEILLMPPTLGTIEELQPFTTVKQLLEKARGKHIYPILPQAFQTPSGPGFKLPHDPEYTIKGFKQPPRSHEPSRIMLIDGIWQRV